MNAWSMAVAVEVISEDWEGHQLFGLTLIISADSVEPERPTVDLFADGFLIITPDGEVSRRYLDITEIPEDREIRIGALCKVVDARSLALTVAIDGWKEGYFDLRPLESGKFLSELRETNSENIPRRNPESFPPLRGSDRSSGEPPLQVESDQEAHTTFPGTNVDEMLQPPVMEVPDEASVAYDAPVREERFEDAYEASFSEESSSDHEEGVMDAGGEVMEAGDGMDEGALRDLGEEGVGETALSDEPPEHTVVTLLFGTNREPDRKSYFSHRRGSLSLGLLKVSVPGDRKLGDLAVPAWWQLWRKPDPAKHFYISDIGPVHVDELGHVIKTLNAQGAGSDHALVFVHGYNTDFEQAGLRAAQLYKDLEFPGIGAFYSWPSRGQFIRYGYDENSVRVSMPYFRQFLEHLADNGIEQLSLVAHSMGNRLVAETLAEANLAIPVNHVLLAAPDIDAQVFREQIAPKLARPSGRYTLYGSDNDKALKLSSFIAGYRRLGDTRDGVVVVAGIDSLDVSDLDATELGHGYVFDRTLLADLHSVLTAGVPPQERFGLRQATSPDGHYWTFKG